MLMMLIWSSFLELFFQPKKMTTIFKKVPSFLGVLSFVKGHQMVKVVIFAAIRSVLLQQSSSQHAPISGSISLVWFLV